MMILIASYERREKAKRPDCLESPHTGTAGSKDKERKVPKK